MPTPQSLPLTLPDRLHIIDCVLQQLNIPKTLPVTHTLESIRNQKKPHNSNQTQVFYHVPGNRHRFRTQLANLVEKLDREDERVQELEGRGEKRSSSQEVVGVVEEEASGYNPEDQFRYYRDNILCFKCNKIGHYKASCPEIPTCMYCLSPTHANQPQKCLQKNVCFRCFSFGHVIAQCKSKQSHTRCPYCQRYHQGSCSFLVPKIRDNGRRRQYYDAIYEHKDIQCIRCMGYGHVECEGK